MLSGVGTVFAQIGKESFKVPADARAKASLLTAEKFKPLTKSNFTVRLDDGSEGAIRLLEVVEKTIATSKSAKPINTFNLIFESRAGASFEDKTYKMFHPSLGELEIFISKVGRSGRRYQAVFASVAF